MSKVLRRRNRSRSTLPKGGETKRKQLKNEIQILREKDQKDYMGYAVLGIIIYSLCC